MGRDKKKSGRGRRVAAGLGRPVMPEMGEDYDNILVATGDLCERAGARGFEVGCLHDDVPMEKADWFALAQFRGARIFEEHHKSPVDAAFALAVRLLTGARCRCGKLVALSEDGAVAFTKTILLHGLGEWNVDEVVEAGQCLWRREGARWEPSCKVAPLTLQGCR